MFDWLSALIENIHLAGLGKLMYNIFFFGGFVGLTTYNVIVAKKYGLTKLQAVLFTLIVYSSSVAMMFFLYWAEDGFKKFVGGNNIVRIFVWVPVFIYPAAKLFKISWLKGCDFLSPCVCINHGIAHLGCIFVGCCHSFVYEGGVYNPTLSLGGETAVKTFPIQPIEAIVALLIAFYIMRREKKKDYKTDGLSFPIMLMLFGYSRFFIEFARDNQKYFFGISNLAIHALVCGIVGSVLFVIVKVKNKKGALDSDKLCLKVMLLGATVIETIIVVLKQVKIKPQIYAALIVGSFLMFGVMALCRVWRREVKLSSLALVTPLLTIAGTLGAYLMAFIENGRWGGISFYGSVFVIPVWFMAVAFAFGIKHGTLLDYCAPSVCIMLAVNRINCLLTGCCRGMVLSVDENGNVTRFPSQIVELITVLLIMVALIWVIKKGKCNGVIYPLFMISYGVTRFGLNLLRETNGVFFFGLSAGCFWSVIAVTIGIIWIFCYRFAKKKVAD